MSYAHDDDDRYGDDLDDLREPGRPEKRQRLSLGVRFLIGLGVTAGLACLACCGLGGWIMVKFRGAMLTTPAEVAKVRDEIITDIDLPERFQPRMAMDFQLWGGVLRFAAYANEGDSETVVLMQMPAEASPEDVRQQVQHAMGQQEQFDVESFETRTISIEGKPVDFQFAKGTSRETGRVVRQVVGAFPGRHGTVMVVYIVPEEDWDEEDGARMLEKIRK